jgi:hypothetical protein
MADRSWADADNRQTLRGAFTATWANYAELAERAAGRPWSGSMARSTGTDGGPR